ncbi:MAG TPA: hypothetical protein VHY59_06705 [Chthoniobacterales bacterium]|nr:hypothetical protein [Chthoniobacterales bacterium]
MAKKTIQSSDIMLALIVEGVGIGFLTLLAGTSEDVGTTIVVFMVGLWLLFLFNHQGVQSYITNVGSNIQGALNG